MNKDEKIFNIQINICDLYKKRCQYLPTRVPKIKKLWSSQIIIWFETKIWGMESYFVEGCVEWHSHSKKAFLQFLIRLHMQLP
jgi:hypothetical protein